MNLGYRPYKDVIYRLDGYVISDLEEATYPKFGLFHKEEIIFHTLEEAERKIAELAEEKTDIVSLYERCLLVFIAIIHILNVYGLIHAMVS